MTQIIQGAGPILPIRESDVTSLVGDLSGKTPTATTNALNFKNSVRSATQANQASLSGLLTLDGYTTLDGDRVLLKVQTTTSQNGIWIMHSGAWTRPVDFATGADVVGSVVYIEGGNTNAGQLWALSSPATPVAIIVDTTAQTWAQVSAGAATGTSLFNTTQQFAPESTANIAAAATGRGSAHDTGNNVSAGNGWSRFRAFANVDQPGNIMIDQSPDNSTWYNTVSIAIGASAPTVIESVVSLRYVRMGFNNTGTVTAVAVYLASVLVAV